MSWDAVINRVYEENEKKLSCLSPQARQIALPYLQVPCQPSKTPAIEDILIRMVNDSEENRKYYEEAIQFIQSF